MGFSIQRPPASTVAPPTYGTGLTPHTIATPAGTPGTDALPVSDGLRRFYEDWRADNDDLLSDTPKPFEGLMSFLKAISTFRGLFKSSKTNGAVDPEIGPEPNKFLRPFKHGKWKKKKAEIETARATAMKEAQASAANQIGTLEKEAEGILTEGNAKKRIFIVDELKIEQGALKAAITDLKADIEKADSAERIARIFEDKSSAIGKIRGKIIELLEKNRAAILQRDELLEKFVQLQHIVTDYQPVPGQHLKDNQREDLTQIFLEIGRTKNELSSITKIKDLRLFELRASAFLIKITEAGITLRD